MNAQFKKGALELCVLALLAHTDQYGYELVKKISGKIEIAKGTLYPLLKKMTRDNYLSTYFIYSTEGPQRKYYSITDVGKERMNLLVTEWINFSKSVHTILEENSMI